MTFIGTHGEIKKQLAEKTNVVRVTDMSACALANDCIGENGKLKQTGLHRDQPQARELNSEFADLKIFV